MGRKCTAYGCLTGYAKAKTRDIDKDKSNVIKKDFQPKPHLFQDRPNICVFSFPHDIVIRQAWIEALPNDIRIEDVTKNMGICAMHFPPSAKMKYAGGKPVPDEPPSLNFRVNDLFLKKEIHPRTTLNSSSLSSLSH